MLATAAAISASAVTLELLTNGKGTTLDGWQNSGFAIQTTDGVSWFRSGHTACRLSQTVTLSDYGFTESDIQGGPTMTASGIVQADVDKDGSGSRICNVKVVELDAGGSEIATHSIMDRADELITSETAFSNSFQLNSNTRRLKYEINGQDSVNWGGYFGPKFRNCSLTISVGVQLWENGPVWAECNIGASNPEDYGYYFWWGDTIGYKCENNAWVASDGSTGNFSFNQGNTPTYGQDNAALLSAGYIDSTGNLVPAHDAATAHFGFPWRMPTDTDVTALLANCTSTWITTNGVSGRLFTGKGSYANKSIFIPAAGRGSRNSGYIEVGIYGYYWTSSPWVNDPDNAKDLDFGESYTDWRARNRDEGRSVRPIIAPLNFTFVSEGSTISNVACQICGETTSTVPTASRDGNYAFLGYFTEESGGVQIFDENYEFVKGTLSSLSWENTLYAHWEAVHTFNFNSEGLAVGSATYGESEVATAPIAQRIGTGDYVFEGYYTEDGVQVFDEHGALVEGALASLPPNVTLYARWAPPEGSIARLVYRGQLDLLTGGPAANDTAYTKKMHFRVYDGEESATPLWKTNDLQVTVNADGSFVQAFGDETLAALIATGSVTHVGLALGTSADTAVELKPRRALRPVAAVNRAITAEGAAPDIRIGNLVTENAIVAADATVSQLEVAGTVTAPGAGRVEVTPLVVGPDERTRLLRGSGVSVFSREKPQTLPLDKSGAVLRGEVLATAPSDGIALISSKDYGRRALRCPAVIQYCRQGEKIRAPTTDDGGLKVTFFPFVGAAK